MKQIYRYKNVRKTFPTPKTTTYKAENRHDKIEFSHQLLRTQIPPVIHYYNYLRVQKQLK